MTSSRSSARFQRGPGNRSISNRKSKPLPQKSCWKKLGGKGGDCFQRTDCVIAGCRPPPAALGTLAPTGVEPPRGGERPGRDQQPMADFTSEQAKENLKNVFDPEIGIN